MRSTYMRIISAAFSGRSRASGRPCRPCSAGGPGSSALSAAASANVSIVSYCLEHGVGVNWKDASGNTALHYACYVGQIETVAFLLSVKDVDVNCMTVCHLFMTNKFLRLCLLLNTDILLLRKCLFQGLSSGSMNAMLLVFGL